MSQSVDFEKIKQQVSVFVRKVRRKFAYLLDCINRFGFNGIGWWFKTHGQMDEFKQALQILRDELTKSEVSLLSIEETFSDFIVPEEDLGHVYWYTDAHNKLQAFDEKLIKSNVVDIKLLQLAMNELKFISQSDEFHQIYQLENIQQRVKDMYQELQQRIIDQQSIEKSTLETDRQQHVADLARIEAEKITSIAKTKMMESVKIKEKRLAIIEDKKRKLIEKETLELKIREQNEAAEHQAKQAEIERQNKLQESYRELEITEKIKELPLEELIEMVNKKIEKKQILTFIQLDQLSKLKHTIEEKKA